MNDPVHHILDDKGRTVHTISPGESVTAAVAEMNRQGVGALVVVDGDRPVGIFTERDVLVRVVGEGVDAAKLTVREVMTPDLVTIRPTTTVTEAMMVVTERRCRHLPVLDGDGRLTGLISIGDLTRWTVRGQERRIEDLYDYITGAYPR